MMFPKTDRAACMRGSNGPTWKYTSIAELVSSAFGTPVAYANSSPDKHQLVTTSTLWWCNRPHDKPRTSGQLHDTSSIEL